VGRLFERQKNVSVLIKAFRLIEDGNYKLLIVGEGPSEGYYRELAGNDKRIIFTGKIDMTGKKMGDVYGSIDALVLPSNWEGLSLTVIEAANYSVPLIISESAYCKDLKQNGLGNLISFDNNNAEQLKNAILSLKNKKIRDAAIKVSANIAEMFTEDIMIKRYQVMLKKL
jgi:glycosyltransferase involved in cell wall biosynthesis